MDRTDNLIYSMNEIADIISGIKNLYACVYNDNNTVDVIYLASVGLIPSFYGKSVAFYITSKNYEEFKKDFFKGGELDNKDYWFGDFDKNGGGAGDLLFTLAGRRID